MKEIESILVEFQSHGFSQTSIEHALDLEFGSIERALLTDDPEMIALLRIIKTYPWLLQVAENNYNETEAERILLHNAVDALINEKHNKKTYNVQRTL